MSDAYETVARAIRFLRANAAEQPTLADVAAHVGMSEFHLQRVFSAWAGISPKRFLQLLTRDRAVEALRGSKDILHAAFAAGLSGPGRLHDLMVAVDALTPGEVKAGGAGIEIRFGFADSPFGEVLVGRTRRGVCHLQFVAEQRENAIMELRAAWPHAAFVRDDPAAGALLEKMFTTVRGRRPIPGLLKGTNFQLKVWEALVRVPPGAVVSYGELAATIGVPSASRAVGNALRTNAIALLIPCHRVIRGDGDIGSYRWGAERKGAILAWEAARTSHTS